MPESVEQVFRYPRPSTAGVVDGRSEIRLSTSGGRTPDGWSEHPWFFDGFLGQAEQMATGLLTVARVARTRFYVPPGMLAAVLRTADPVVTSNRDRLRFESFSACCGVYARLDVLPAAMDRPARGTGTTNVDFNPPMRQALAGIGGLDPLHLSVGDDVAVTTMDRSVTERKVPLPQRWLKGFAEVQLVAANMVPALEISVVEARRFLRSVPARSGGLNSVLWAVPAGRGLRLTSRPAPGAVCVAGPERLKVMEPLLRFATALRAYGDSSSSMEAAASVWELELRDARLVVTLSPDAGRGFSGEGGVLRDLAGDDAAADSDLVSALLAFEPTIDVARLAADAEIDENRVLRALGRLGAAGRVGFDAHESAYFHRELPYDATALDRMHPRLRDARRLVDEGRVRVEGAVSYVTSRDTEYVVRRAGDSWRCTCPWYGKHRNSRGPCKHVLAVEIAADRSP